MDALKIMRFCRPFRFILGILLIAYAVYSGNSWFYLGFIPLIAGILNICPACKITNQCTLIGGKRIEKNEK